MKQYVIGNWTFYPTSGRLMKSGKVVQLDLRSMRLLLYLIERPGEIVPTEELLKAAWPDVAVSIQSVYQVMTSLRRTLGDDSREPSYIETVPREGYRMIAAVEDSPEGMAETIKRSKVGRSIATWLAGVAAIGLLVFCGLHFRHALHKLLVQPLGSMDESSIAKDESSVAKPYVSDGKKEQLGPGGKDKDPLAVPAAAAIGRSVAVLPFLDLTEGMKEETFADGMTEEIIDKLSKIPGFRVPSASSSFYFKDKNMAPAEIANSLGVEYVIDGSVRKSGDKVRVATRLMLADNGYVIWSETYDRPFRDLVKVQDEIASQVVKELQPAGQR